MNPMHNVRCCRLSVISRIAAAKLAISLIAIYKALGGRWRIHEADDFDYPGNSRRGLFERRQN